MSSEPFPVTIFHNPACGTSRNTLAMIEASGEKPIIVLYVETGWNRPQLQELLAAMNASPREILRTRGTPAEALGLTVDGVADDDIVAAMLAHPILVNRPIVQTPKGTQLCRPSEAVFSLLRTPPGRFVKEDGEVVGVRS